LKYRTFGRTGWNVSELGFGAWQIGGRWGKIDDHESMRALLYAFEEGINYVDTAQSYGNGHSEEVICRALKEWRGGKIYVATKVQPVRWPSVDDDHPPMRGRYPAWYLGEEVDGCLRRLGVERLDLLQLHCWIEAGIQELDWLETLNALRSKGKIDRIGVSLRDYRPEEGISLARLGLVDSMQLVFNLFEQRPADQLFRQGQASGTAFAARVPFDSSSLVGNWTEATYEEWDSDDIRRKLFRDERFQETLERVRKLKEVCAPFYPSLAQAAVQFCLSDPSVSVVVAGMKTQAEVAINIKACDGRSFPAELLEAVKPHRWVRNFYK
jgi:aryl-alcohol dehydrogenase-like predicted oxidoreductase